MQPFPHRYVVSASAAESGDIDVTAPALPAIVSAPPAEFDGPGDRWSPETLLIGAVGDCLVLTFRAVARASRVSWTSLRCDVAGTLARLDNVTQFTEFDVRARLTIPAGTDPLAARQALERAERRCLISNSLKASIHLDIQVDVAPTLAGAA
jgi:organic hydroperoxide reductase OsmC/OhrA